MNGKTEEVGWTWGTSLEPGKLSVRASHPGRPQQMRPTVNVGISYFNTDFAVLSAEERGVSPSSSPPESMQAPPPPGQGERNIIYTCQWVLGEEVKDES